MEDGKIILGIDPGTVLMGYAVISCRDKTPCLTVFGILELDKEEDGMKRLKKIFDKVIFLIDTYRPDVLAIESPFYGKNVQSMLKLGRAQGTVIAAALHRNLEVKEYAPRKIKSAVTGNGNASKEQVAGMVQHLLKIKIEVKYLDVTDALAVALCHFYSATEGSPKSGKKKTYSGWSDFIKKEKDRIKKR